MGKVSRANLHAFALALAGGIMLVAAHLSGVTFWTPVAQQVADALRVPVWVFLPLLILAALGGISVIIGGFLIRSGRVDGGTVCIALGVGTDFIGLVIAAAGVLYGNSAGMGAASVLGVIGVILSIGARIKARRPGAR